MPKVKVLNLRGEEVGEEVLPEKIFNVGLKIGLVHKVVRTILANRRLGLAHTKVRSEVRGGGIKPWKQKGTGRARVGSIRSPLWRKGGTVFGPRKERNYHLKVNKKERKQALFMTLNDKFKNNHLIVVDNLELPAMKTKEMARVLDNLKLSGKKVLVVLPAKDEKVLKAARNLARTKVVNAAAICVEDILNYNYCLLPKESLKVISNHFISKS